VVNVPAEAHRPCANCEAPLHGRYCAACGQEAHGSARSLATLLHDVWHDLSHLDGRLWRTIEALAIRPGHLTVEYLRDRRARYLPPFRVYLVLSILFFAVAAASSHGAADGTVLAGSDAQLAEARRQLDHVARDLERSGKGAAADVLRRAARDGEAEPQRKEGPEAVAAMCESLAQRGGPRLRQAAISACMRSLSDGGREVGHAFLANVPKTMFLFLPGVALVMFALFGRARRFYVEHVVLVLHLQSALFLLGAAALGAEAALGWAGAPGWVADLVVLAAWAYGAWYAYRSLRTVYGESRAPTIAKLAVLGFAYAVLLGVTLLGTAVWSAFTA
jgi:hypothetical protein